MERQGSKLIASTMHDPSVIDPQERLKHLINYCNAVEVDWHIPPHRYYRSGLEMVRMANVYYKEGSLENAYVLYLKFMTLFLEKIRKHPDFASVTVRDKAINQAKLREVLPKAEKLKRQLLELYQADFNRYSAELREHRARESVKAHKTSSTGGSTPVAASAAQLPATDVKTPVSLDDIAYPDPNATSPSPSSPASSFSSITPSIDRSSKPDLDYQNYGSGLRPVIIPSNVMVAFLAKAHRNTSNNVETCGILVGKLSRNQLIVTHLIIPKQRGTSDSCTTMNEEELFDYQDQHNLITIGWIHTHPTQTAFLSSVDLHTHCPYQLLMPEAIAIVCAPRYDETGFFVLTPNYGLKYIANCRLTGFHPHPTEPPLFMIADHVKIEQDATLEILDLRTNT